MSVDDLTEVGGEIVVFHQVIVTRMHSLSIDSTLPHQLGHFPVDHRELILTRGSRCSRNQANLIFGALLSGLFVVHVAVELGLYMGLDGR